jgi:Tol biopolymer transport system component
VRVINSDRTGGARLFRSEDGLEYYIRPSWSPDGRHVAFGMWILDGEELDRDQSGLFVMKADGTEVRKFAADPVEVAWQPRP